MWEKVQAITGMLPISDTHKQVLPQFILPVIEILINDNLPDVTMIQTSCLEPFKYESVNVNLYGNLGAAYTGYVNNSVVGQAGKETELVKFITELSKTNKGGFLGEIFSVASNIAHSIGI